MTALSLTIVNPVELLCRLFKCTQFIVEIEGAPQNCDVTRWGRFTDIKDIKREMLKRLEAHFEKWLNP